MTEKIDVVFRFSQTDITIEGLLGERDLHLNPNSDVTILIGENGAGKSTALKILHSWFCDDFVELGKYRFDGISFHNLLTHMQIIEDGSEAEKSDPRDFVNSLRFHLERNDFFPRVNEFCEVIERDLRLDNLEEIDDLSRFLDQLKGDKELYFKFVGLMSGELNSSTIHIERELFNRYPKVFKKKSILSKLNSLIKGFIVKELDIGEYISQIESHEIPVTSKLSKDICERIDLFQYRDSGEELADLSISCNPEMLLKEFLEKHLSNIIYNCKIFKYSPLYDLICNGSLDFAFLQHLQSFLVTPKTEIYYSTEVKDKSYLRSRDLDKVNTLIDQGIGAKKYEESEKTRNVNLLKGYSKTKYFGLFGPNKLFEDELSQILSKVYCFILVDLYEYIQKKSVTQIQYDLNLQIDFNSLLDIEDEVVSIDSLIKRNYYLPEDLLRINSIAINSYLHLIGKDISSDIETYQEVLEYRNKYTLDDLNPNFYFCIEWILQPVILKNSLYDQVIGDLLLFRNLPKEEQVMSFQDFPLEYYVFLEFYFSNIDYILGLKSSLIDGLESAIKRFIPDKYFSILPKGLKVYKCSNGEEVDLNLLSTGERKILYLLLVTIFVKSHVLMIDEPEASFSIDWQEKLIETLTITGTGNTILFTTHSPYIVRDSKFADRIIVLGKEEEDVK